MYEQLPTVMSQYPLSHQMNCKSTCENEEMSQLMIVKKLYLKRQEENEEINKLRQTYCNQNHQCLQEKQQWWRSNNNLPNDLVKKLNKLQNNFLKDQKNTKVFCRKNNQNLKIKNLQQNEKKISQIFKDIEKNLTQQSNVNNSNSKQINKILYEKLVNLYNQFIALQKNNITKRKKMEELEKRMDKQSEEISELQKQLQIKKQHLQYKKLQRIQKINQFIAMKTKLQSYVKYQPTHVYDYQL